MDDRLVILDEIIRSQVEEYRKAVERACSQALQGGKHGVLIEHDVSYTRFRISVSDEVPYGSIYERTVAAHEL